MEVKHLPSLDGQGVKLKDIYSLVVQLESKTNDGYLELTLYEAI
jgi:hypothetical protein